MVSLKDIANRCNVSTATVSKALNGHMDIGEATKERIRAVAKEIVGTAEAGAVIVKLYVSVPSSVPPDA